MHAAQLARLAHLAEQAAAEQPDFTPRSSRWSKTWLPVKRTPT